jgi:NAD(P)-dependent dehydrogenase (short-subunit alcohol dehydrogenase family)
MSKLAVITGGIRGIGAAISVALKETWLRGYSKLRAKSSTCRRIL